MSGRYLEVTYRHGRPIAAYLYPPRRLGDRSVRSERHTAGLVVDFTADGRPIGIEITSPSAFTVDALNAVLRSINTADATADELAPLHAA